MRGNVLGFSNLQFVAVGFLCLTHAQQREELVERALQTALIESFLDEISQVIILLLQVGGGMCCLIFDLEILTEIRPSRRGECFKAPC